MPGVRTDHCLPGVRAIMNWPNAQEYNEAVQCSICIEDPELRAGFLQLNSMGLPKVASGNFASVYRMNCGNRAFGMKCFLRNVYDQHQRYAQLSQFTAVTHVPHMVEFEYQLKGIYVEESWFPIVKMEWVDGVGLDQFLRKNWSNKQQIDRVIRQFVELVQGLQKAGMAHGDLQHGNIMVKNDAVKLVDYDGMFVPSMKGQTANELGHSNYQHPGRCEQDFGPNLDDFSAWIIYYSLLFLKLDPGLWQRFAGGDDCLLFRQADFIEPDRSRLLAELARHPVPDIRTKAEHVQQLIRCRFEQVPKFSFDLPKLTAAVTAHSNGSVPALDEHPTVVTGSDCPSPSPVDEQKLAPVVERWPAADAYYQALRMPTKTLFDDNLSKCLLCTTFGKNTIELEVDAGAMTFEKAALRGRRHVVFRMALIDGTRHYAIKCFLQPQSERQVRWDAIKKHKKPNSNRFFTQFVYLPKGIVVDGDICPVVKMLWVDGETIDRYVARHLQIGYVEPIEALRQQFIEMMQALAADDIAHGDLEPTNILVTPSGQLILVDYDNMYVPALAHLESTEVGHPNFQHPTRNLSNLGPYLDNYSAIVIDGILACMNADPPVQLRNWDNLLLHLNQKSDGRVGGGQTSAMSKWTSPRSTGTQIKVGGAGHSRPSSGESWNALKDSDVQENKFETASSKLQRQIKELHKYRLDLVPSLWTVRSAGL